VLAPETANNATVGGALLPTMTLGVPGTPAAAILLGAFAINNLTPGPKLFEERGDIMYAIYIGLFVINIVMMVIGYFAIRFAAQIIRVPQTIVLPTVLLLSICGIFATFNSLFAVAIMLAAGVFGYIIRKLGFSVAPLVIGFVLGVIFEDGFRQSITTSQGSILEFFNTPIGLVVYALLFLTLFGEPLWKWVSKRLKRGGS
jgi:putative tricarboxylic transport membrane protein